MGPNPYPPFNHTTMKVRPELLPEIASQLEGGAAPLSEQWILDREVTAEEFAALTGKLALIVRGYLALRPSEQYLFTARGILTTRPIEGDDLTG